VILSAVLRNHIRVFATDTTIQNALSPSDDPACKLITWEDLETLDIFVRIDQRRLDQWGRIVGMLITQVVRSLEGRPDKHSLEGEKLEPVLLLLDEFPRFKMEVIVGALETLRSKKVTIALFCQSLADLEGVYDENTSRRIMDNCHFKAILNAGDPKSQQLFSILVGTKCVVIKGINSNYSFDQGNVSGVGINLGESTKPVIEPHEFASLNCIVLLHPEGFSFVDNPSHLLPNHPKNTDNRLYLNP
jgi:type IV secretory pathway TraG/TraD family ATPase VirD4